MPSPPAPGARYDDHGFPLPADKAFNETKTQTPIVCPTCLDASGSAGVTLTGKYGLATYFCPICRTRCYANSVTAHDLMRRWQRILADPALRQALMEQLASIP